MLPYTPMHHLMFDAVKRPLVMTSANYSSEPMIHTNEDALKKLNGLGDEFLLHDRDIVNRCEDSVCAVYGGQTIILRPGRGMAPVSFPDCRRDAPVASEGDEGVASTLKILKSGINCPMTSSMGRLFDAVAVLLGACETPTFDGEGPMRLEAMADSDEQGTLPALLSGGVFQNRLLVEGIKKHPAFNKRRIFFSSYPNDSTIALGQAAWGLMSSEGVSAE